MSQRTDKGPQLHILLRHQRGERFVKNSFFLIHHNTLLRQCQVFPKKLEHSIIIDSISPRSKDIQGADVELEGPGGLSRT